MLNFKLKIKTQIITLASILLIFQILMAISGLYFLKNIQGNLESVFSDRLPAIDNLVQADRDFQQALVAERTILTGGEKVDIAGQVKDYIKNKKQVIDRFNIYKTLARSSAEQEEITKFEVSYNEWKDYSEKNLNIEKIASIKSEDRQSLLDSSIGQVATLFEKARTSLDNLQEIILKDAEAEYKSSKANYDLSVNLTLWLLGFAFTLSFIFSFIFIKSINSKVSKALDVLSNEKKQLDEISVNLSDNSKELAVASQEQSSCVTQTSSSVHEISQMVKKNTDMAINSSGLVNKGKTQLSSGVDIILELANQVQNINKSSLELTDKVGKNHVKLEEILNVFENIREKTSVINDIVFQTKLLSFNASVESARAGEHGKGFAVVAEEVGNLARLSGESANEITDLLNSSLDNVTKIIGDSKRDMDISVKGSEALINVALNLSKDCEKILQDVNNMFNEITQSSDEIASASREQSQGVEEINIAVQEINTTNQQTSQKAELVDLKSRQLIDVVNNIESSIEELKQLV